jgi:protoporphyrinogen/coproporphyrinogen III oxidase
MSRHQRKAAVLGGGLTGLSAAFYLRKYADERGLPLELTVLEGTVRLGGKVNTLRRDGFVIERGPDSFLARKLPMIRLAEELGIEDQLTGTNPAAKNTYISRNGKLMPMPKGLTLGVPTDEKLFLANGLVSDEGKRRALEELHLPPKQGMDDESVGSFLERRFGEEMVERIFEPLLAGIHAGDLFKLGLEATFPQFAELERKYGSVIRGMTESADAAKNEMARTVVHAPSSVFLTFRNGLSTVIEALASSLRTSGSEIRLGANVVSIEKNGQSGYVLTMHDGSTLEADLVLSTLPAHQAAELLSPHLDVSALEDIRYVSVANVVFGYDEAEFGEELDGSGFLVPRSEGRTITASTWTSAKWRHTAPAGKRLVRCYVGRSGEEQNVELGDEQMTAKVRSDLEALMGLKAKPEFVEITRLRQSMPQYPVGHPGAIARLHGHLAERLPGLRATGAAFGGIGLPDCVEQGRQAAELLLGDI